MGLLGWVCFTSERFNVVAGKTPQTATVETRVGDATRWKTSVRVRLSVGCRCLDIRRLGVSVTVSEVVCQEECGGIDAGSSVVLLLPVS